MLCDVISFHFISFYFYVIVWHTHTYTHTYIKVLGGFGARPFEDTVEDPMYLVRGNGTQFRREVCLIHLLYLMCVCIFCVATGHSSGGMYMLKTRAGIVQLFTDTQNKQSKSDSACFGFDTYTLGTLPTRCVDGAWACMLLTPTPPDRPPHTLGAC